MNILAFDTTTPACSAALWRNGDVASSRSEVIGTGHAERLMPMIDEMLASANTRYDALDGLGVTRGPGSFTGVRIGLATARGLALATGLPLVGLSTLDVLAAGISRAVAGERNIVAVLDARRGQFYVAVYGPDGAPGMDAEAIAVSDMAERLSGQLSAAGVILCGTGATLVQPVLAAAGIDAVVDTGNTHPSATAIARIAAENLDSGIIPGPVAPLYLRGSGAARPAVGQT